MRGRLALGFTAVALLFGLAAPRDAEARGRISVDFSAGFSLDPEGYWVGPHGGLITPVSGYYLETVVLPGGDVRVYAYDEYGNSVPASALGLGSITLETEYGPVRVRLGVGGYDYLAGYYDPFYYDSYFARGYGYFHVGFPQYIYFYERPVTIARHSRYYYEPRYYNPGRYYDARRSYDRGYRSYDAPRSTRYPRRSYEAAPRYESSPRGYEAPRRYETPRRYEEPRRRDYRAAPSYRIEDSPSPYRSNKSYKAAPSHEEKRSHPGDKGSKHKKQRDRDDRPRGYRSGPR
jgi:hypothetical protein